MSIGTIGSIILLAFIIGYFGYKYYRGIKNAENNKELKDFFNSIREAVESAMIDYLENIDIQNIININNMQKEVLNDMYDTVWNICVNKLADMQDETTAKIIKLTLTRKNVEAFIEEIYKNSIPVQEEVTAKYNDKVVMCCTKKLE